jgi:pimeloyl-ACP methyl ester carboxylesterase
LICVHGAADNHQVFDRLLDRMPEVDRYAINLPGRAGTDGPPLQNVRKMEEFLSSLVEAELDGDYLVVGHSLGGAVAIEHALRCASARLKGIVLLATGARLRVHPMIPQLFEQASKSGKMPPLTPGLYEGRTDPELVAEASRKRLATPIETGSQDWRAADSFDRMHDLGNIRVPALIVAGTDDALTPSKYAEYLEAHIPRALMELFDGASHMFVLERASELGASIERFAAGL